MPGARDEIVRKLWRGENPFLSSIVNPAAPDSREWRNQHPCFVQDIESRRPSIIVDAGARKGISAIHMAFQLRELGIDGVVIAVDTWLGSWHHWVEDRWFPELGPLEQSPGMFATFLRNIKSTNLEDYIVPLPLDPAKAALVLNHFEIFPDVVHIDSGSDYDAVAADLGRWWPLLKPGGLLIGGGYGADGTWSDARRAFDDHFRPLGLTPLENAGDKCRVFKPRVAVREDNLSAVLRSAGSAAAAWREDCRIDLTSLQEDDGIGVEELLDRYVRTGAPYWYDGRHKIMAKIVRGLKTNDRDFTREDVFGADCAVRTDVVRSVLPDFTADYPRAARAEGLERFELLAAVDNPFAPFALPGTLNINMGKAKAPPLAVYRTGPCDLFLTPLGYQLFRDGEWIYWPAASTRPYPREAMPFPHVTIQKCVVIVQDGFEGTNYSHFLFDWIPRFSHFLNAGLEDPADCVFVMGGAPSEFHVHVMRAFLAIHGLNESEIVFPSGPQIWHIERPVYFFSDFKENIMHPAHMANPRSIAVIRDICARVPAPTGDVRRLYISRGDTPLRKIANEDDLTVRLRSFGFVEVQLAAIPFLEQVKLIRGADVIVAPHGMGLTHLAFHEGRPLIIELHNPALGTDAYAFIARALGFTYHAVLGVSLEGSGHHYTILPDDVVTVLAREGIEPLPASDDDALSGGRSVFYGGVQSIASFEVFNVIPPCRPGSAVYAHMRTAAVIQPDDNVGWWEVSGLIIGAVYHCCCEVWIPSGFDGNNIKFVCEDLATQVVRPPDLTVRDQWQTIGVKGAAVKSLINCVLRCDAGDGATFYSNGWRTGQGTEVDRV